LLVTRRKRNKARNGVTFKTTARIGIGIGSVDTRITRTWANGVNPLTK